MDLEHVAQMLVVDCCCQLDGYGGCVCVGVFGFVVFCGGEFGF